MRCGITSRVDMGSVTSKAATRLQRGVWAYVDGARGGVAIECDGSRLGDVPKSYRNGDVLGFLVNVENGIVTMYRNGVREGQCSGLPRDGTPLFPFVAFGQSDDAIRLVCAWHIEDSSSDADCNCNSNQTSNLMGHNNRYAD